MPAARPWIGAVLALAVSVSIGADCLIGRDAPAGQMACCAGTDHDCQAVRPEDCCAGSDTQRQLPADRGQTTAPATIAPVLAFAAIPAPVAPAPDRLVGSQESAHRSAAAPPVYIRLATLLI